MKKIALLLLFSTTSLLAQTGEGASDSAVKAKDFTWQNWAFAGGAAIAAAIGITLVIIDGGSSSNSH